MNRIIICAAVAASVALAGCATRARSVAPVSISASEYSALDCQETRQAYSDAQRREASLASRQNTAAAVDAAGVFLVLIPVGSIVGVDVAGDLAQAKGETLALERHLRTACSQKAETAPQPAPETAAPVAAPAALPPGQHPATAPARCGMVRQPNGSMKRVPCD